MEIKNLRANAIRSYEKLANAVPAKKDTGKSAVKANTDKVDFDFSSALAAAKANVASAADAEANTARINELQAQYAGDSCPIPSESIATAILSMGM
ncbi:MAG: hypothetical protein K2K41_00005 [Ruminiclostridium sp.]|nr:hypothetical protein [Ruminiclostridium sp.]MDE6725754.1 hypothetical protein [Ruminiclostridium sp.]